MVGSDDAFHDRGPGNEMARLSTVMVVVPVMVASPSSVAVIVCSPGVIKVISPKPVSVNVWTPPSAGVKE
jgi:hypothetical protein